ncbi:MAG: RNA modification enzyme, MiaB family [Candidatus Roizmanbacteria bacterium GW2011_GWC2_37_13]|uniref:RNA modification enzyme, MiaB family n=1 Tax=Candidatus Roizmanbacteria bacterium GW2011_GWC2_37_13 TaxID=1618486 RepID=A0A0G0GE42_9BACT|nr:MAG: RNA modification enzyme, MiaB family [Candidatus Roizmanbacteria bacterium GW2011_GWC1_37_12]KKQ24320.1 MAG: RNA modification enzyme, MiaB family [Candidatus Roizmanbacteria bacterium GW2011_GWC2_37_13]
MKYFIKTFGCQQNHSDSERIESALKSRGMTRAKSYKTADYIVINTCMIRESAENRVYGLVNNLSKFKILNSKFKIIVTGCMVGLAFRDKTGKYLRKIRETMPEVDEFLPIEEIGFDNAPLRQDRINAWIPISNGCNNFCTFCVVPFTRGREISRPYQDIISDCKDLKKRGYRIVTLLGQNVNSYGADLILGEKNIQVMRDLDKTYFEKSKVKNQKSKLQLKIKNLNLNKNLKFKIENYKPIYVKHLGRYRIPTLFPHLLEEIARMGFEKVDFISSNPWDFSDELIDVIARNKNITRLIHLPVQSGDDNVLKRMNRWYSASDYVALISKIKNQISNIRFSTDIIVGFCGETEKEFKNTVKLAKKVGFEKAYLAMYSQRPMTAATKVFKDDIPHTVKEKRWLTLEKLINRPRLALSRN